MEKYLMEVARTTTGYSAYNEAEGALTTASNLAELKRNIVEVMNLAVSDLNITLTIEHMQLKYDMASFFDANKYLSAAGVAKEIGMSQSLLSQYINGIKKPGEKQTARILQGIRALGQRLVEVEFAA